MPPSSNVVAGFPSGTNVYFQGDGNFVTYNASGFPLAATESNVFSPTNLSLNFQEDGNFVLYSNGQALWASNTAPAASGGTLVLRDHSPYIQITKGKAVFWTSTEAKQG